MPRLNPITGAIANLRHDWYDQTRTVQQECNTLQPGCVVALSDGTIVYGAGSNGVTGGGGVWALLGFDDGVVHTSTGLLLPGADIGPCGWDGAIAIKDVRNSYGPWHVHELRDDVWLLTSGDAYDIQLLSAHRAIWREAPSTALHCTPGLGLTTPAPEGTWGWPRAVEVDGRWRLLYQSYAPACLVLDGHVVAEGTTFYQPDVVYLNGVILIAWALDQADTQIVTRSLTPAELDALPLVPAPTPPDPEPPEPEPEPPQPEPEPEPEPEPPEPEPEPPKPEPEPEQPMAIYLKLGHAYTGVDPTPVPAATNDAQYPVYADREAGGPWEEVILTRHEDGAYDALYVAANRTLSIQPDGTLQTRPGGTYGGYEAVCATTQPDGASILYRRDADIVIPCNVLTIEDRQP